MVTYGPQPDRPPSSPHASDEEFATSSLTGWSVLDSGASQSYDAHTTLESCLYIGANSAGRSPGIYKATPTIPFTVTACIAGYANPTGTAVRTDVGLMLGEATPGKFFHGWLDVAEDAYFSIVGSAWTNPTTWSANIGDFLNTGSGAGSRSRTSGFALMRKHYSRFVVNSTSDVDGYFSFDGLVYTQWLTAYNPGFTIGSVGIDMHTGSVGHSVDCAVAVDWLRFKDGTDDPTIM